MNSIAATMYAAVTSPEDMVILQLFVKVTDCETGIKATCKPFFRWPLQAALVRAMFASDRTGEASLLFLLNILVFLSNKLLLPLFF